MMNPWSDIPCTDCPYHKEGLCKFYKVELDEIAPGVYIPCEECEGDFERSMGE